jgi:hypothetical protein
MCNMLHSFILWDLTIYLVFSAFTWLPKLLLVSP